MRWTMADGVQWDRFRVALPIAGALALACGSAASPDAGNAGASGAGTGGSAGAGGATTAGSSSSAGHAAVAGNSGSSAGPSVGGTGQGGTGQGGAATAGTGGSVSGNPLVHSVCLQEASHLCVDQYQRDSKEEADRVCVFEGQGTILEKCPSAGLIGCCFLPGDIVDGVILYGDVNYCFYEGDVDGLREDTCVAASGTWSHTPPP